MWHPIVGRPKGYFTASAVDYGDTFMKKIRIRTVALPYTSAKTPKIDTRVRYLDCSATKNFTHSTNITLPLDVFNVF